MRALAFALVATSAMSPALAASAVDPAILRQAQDCRNDKAIKYSRGTAETAQTIAEAAWDACQGVMHPSSPSGEITSIIVNGKIFTEADLAANPMLSSVLVQRLDAEREAEIRRLRVLVLETRTAPTK
jgi:hypothetical protein